MKKIILLVVVVIAATGQFSLSNKLSTQWKKEVQAKTNIGILDFEFANGKYRDSLYNSLISTNDLKLSVERHFSTDNKYIFAYVTLLAGLALLFMTGVRPVFKKSFYLLLVVAAIAAGVLDAVENATLLNNIRRGCCYTSAFGYAFIKFLLLAFVIFSLLYNLTCNILYKIRKK
jgi:hypothetical protein